MKALLTIFLIMLSLPSYAFSYIVDMAGAPGTPLTTLPGVGTSSGDLFYVTITPAAAFEYATPSVVSFGSKTTFPASPGAGQSGTFASPTDFYFLVGRSVGGAYTEGPDLIHAFADLNGPVAISAGGIPSSNAVFTNGTGTVVSGPNTGAVSFLTTDPNNGLPANAITLTYDGTPVTVFIDLVSSVPAPDANPLSISGYITDVPELNGAVLLLTGLLALYLMRSKRWR